ncbi:MAG TPA: NADH-quinone oxidoreductase subunit L [Thermoanaerobaculia bacterium]|nr:NADH-quinone oxidoreductase subunit L [Thermoanaerobaculia bacterium]
MLDHLGLIPLLPFLGFVLSGAFGKRAGKAFVTIVALSSVGLSAILATVAVFQYNATYPDGKPLIDVVGQWFQSGGIGADIAFRLDHLSIIMLMVVTWVGFLIHLYSVGYMAHEEGYYRYFAYLNLFLAAMLILVLGSSYLFMFVGWEGVGLCSYLLIGFYYEKDTAAAAGKKAFVVNRIGDFGFLIAMFLMFQHIGSVDFTKVTAAAASGGLAPSVATAICLLLFLGACGKSAQIPLYVWLPDAMAGPTPVSALIHAATMVTAGVYMVVRSNALFRLSPTAMAVVAIVGALTALFAATIGVAQNDIKKVLAYSTVSQLGFMFIGAGVGAFTAAIFHVVTHAFFKACLFLGSGSVIHAMSGEQDIRKMGGLHKKIPITYWTFTVATIAIAGFPLFAGFFSKDAILAAAFSTPFNPGVGKLVWLLGTIAALFTSFYMYRMWYVVFHGEFRGSHDQEHHLHESPATMWIPLVILASLSIVGGFLGIPNLWEGRSVNWIERWMEPLFASIQGHGTGLFEVPPFQEITIALVSTAIALVGFVLARKLYLNRGLATDESFEQKTPGLAHTLQNKYYVDEGYDAVVIDPLNRISVFMWRVIDAIIDGLLSLGAYTVAAFGDLMRFFQTGNVRNYALMFFLGVVIFLFVYV